MERNVVKPSEAMLTQISGFILTATDFQPHFSIKETYKSVQKCCRERLTEESEGPEISPHSPQPRREDCLAMVYRNRQFSDATLGYFSFFRLVNYITFRAIMAALTAVIFVFLFSRRFILFMHRRSLLDQVRETGVHSAFDKSGTPTMGGVLIIGAVLSSMALWGNWHNPFLICSVAGMLWFGLLGFCDDYSKVQRRSGDMGISERNKLIAQGLFAFGFAWFCVGPYAPFEAALATKLYIPFYKYALVDLGPIRLRDLYPPLRHFRFQCR